MDVKSSLLRKGQKCTNFIEKYQTQFPAHSHKTPYQEKGLGLMPRSYLIGVFPGTNHRGTGLENEMVGKFSVFWVNRKYLKEIHRILKGKFLVLTLGEEKNALVKGWSVPLPPPEPGRWVKAALPVGNAVAVACAKALCCHVEDVWVGKACVWVRTPLCKVTAAREVSPRAGAAALPMRSHPRAPRGRLPFVLFVQHVLRFHRGRWVVSRVRRSLALLRCVSPGQDSCYP